MAEELDGAPAAGDFGDFDDFADALAEAVVDEEELGSEDEEGLDEEEVEDDALALDAAEEDKLSGQPGLRPAKPKRRARLADPLPQTVHLVPPEEHLTSDYLTVYEISNVLAVRATQIAQHGTVFLPPGESRRSNDPVELAVQELKAGMNPLEVRRVRSHGPEEYVEVRKVRDLLVPPTAPGVYD